MRNTTLFIHNKIVYLPGQYVSTAQQIIIIIVILFSLLLLTAIKLSPGGSGYFTCVQSMKLFTNKFKSEGLCEKHVVATWNLGSNLSICL